MPGHNSIIFYLILINSAGSSWRVKIHRQFMGNQCSAKLETFGYLTHLDIWLNKICLRLFWLLSVTPNSQLSVPFTLLAHVTPD